MSRSTGSTVHLLDRDAITTLVRASLVAQYGADSFNLELHSADPTAGIVFAVPEGSRFPEWIALTSEGVGVPTSNPYTIEMWDVDQRTVRIPTNAVLAARTGETVDLADHIRTFGSRLDVNHSIWHAAVQRAAKLERTDPAAHPDFPLLTSDDQRVNRAGN